MLTRQRFPRPAICFAPRSELAFTTFFARYVGLDKDPVEFDKWFEEGDITTSRNVAPLFTRAKELGVAICVGYGEKTGDGRHFNSCAYVDGSGKEISKVSPLSMFFWAPLRMLNIGSVAVSQGEPTGLFGEGRSVI